MLQWCYRMPSKIHSLYDLDKMGAHKSVGSCDLETT